MISPTLPLLLVAVLAGAGVYGVLARRNAVLMLVGVELILAAAGLLLVTMGSVTEDPLHAGHVLTIFVISIAAAEIVVALALVMALFRLRGDVDLTVPAGGHFGAGADAGAARDGIPAPSDADDAPQAGRDPGAAR